MSDELGALRQLLNDSVYLPKPGRYIAVIPYHPLEDRMVEEFPRLGSFEQFSEALAGMSSLEPASLRVVTKRATTPPADEMADSSRACSVKPCVMELRGDI